MLLPLETVATHRIRIQSGDEVSWPLCRLTVAAETEDPRGEDNQLQEQASWSFVIASSSIHPRTLLTGITFKRVLTPRF